jgi:hypothetical protein
MMTTKSRQGRPLVRSLCWNCCCKIRGQCRRVSPGCSPNELSSLFIYLERGCGKDSCTNHGSILVISLGSPYANEGLCLHQSQVFCWFTSKFYPSGLSGNGYQIIHSFLRFVVAKSLLQAVCCGSAFGSLSLDFG